MENLLAIIITCIVCVLFVFAAVSCLSTLCDMVSSANYTKVTGRKTKYMAWDTWYIQAEDGTWYTTAEYKELINAEYKERNRETRKIDH